MFAVGTLEQLEAYIRMGLGRYSNDVDHPGIRLSMACSAMAADIRLGNEEAAQIGMAILLRDLSLPFGKLIKSAIARSLKKHVGLLRDPERQWFLYKTSDLLSMEFCLREVENYCALVKKLGPAACRVVVERALPTAVKSRKLLAGLRELVSTPP